MALIATRCPTAEFAQSAVQELDTVYITMRQLGFQKKRALKDLVSGSRIQIDCPGSFSMPEGRHTKIS